MGVLEVGMSNPIQIFLSCPVCGELLIDPHEADTVFVVLGDSFRLECVQCQIRFEVELTHSRLYEGP